MSGWEQLNPRIAAIGFSSQPVEKTDSGPAVLWLVLFGALQVVIALAMDQSPILATAHGCLVGLLALGAAWFCTPSRVAVISAYLAGSDVLWRMTAAQVPWDLAKYVAIVMLVITLIRRKGAFVWRPAPLIYFSLLLPSVLVLLGDPKWEAPDIINAVKFALSGPLVLAISVWFFSQLTLSPTRMRELFLVYLIPTAGIAALTLKSTYTASAITWTTESNFVTSGGFGPNQISTVLGLAALFAFLVSIDRSTPQLLRWLTSGATLIFLMQSAMTFSRGGLYTAAFAATLAAVVMTVGRGKQQRGRSRGIIVLVLVTIALIGVVLPRLNQFTQGALTARLKETTTSGRDELVREDLQVWAEHPILGGGPDATVRYRTLREGTSHTEYSRLLAEHGLFGALAMATLFFMCMGRLLRARDPRERALVIALLTWGALTMAHASMRTLAPGLIIGLAFAKFPDQSEEQTQSYTSAVAVRRAFGAQIF
jgi:O-antigen ligase